MDLPLSRIKNTFTGKEYDIPKLCRNVLYLCLERGCGCQMVSDLQALVAKGNYTKATFCPDCGASLWMVLK